MIQTTHYYYDFATYYYKAVEMEKKSLSLPYGECKDPLMQNVHIYNATIRKNAGFSNMLEDIVNGNTNEKTLPFTDIGVELDFLPMDSQSYNTTMMHYLFLIHRLTGSGASFEPDHGYRNTILPELIKFKDIRDMIKHIKACNRPIFTSKGNQIPPFNKPSKLHGYDKGGIEYLCEYAPQLVKDYVHFLTKSQLTTDRPRTIKEAVDWTLDWQTAHGFKKYKFVLTAFVMDTAEYYPLLVDPTSHCYYGSNAIEALNLLFVNDSKVKKEMFYDNCLEWLCDEFKKPDGSNNDPYSIEDVLCDYIRYVENYIPKWYLKNVPLEDMINKSSIIDHPKNLMRTYVDQQDKEKDELTLWRTTNM